MCFFIPVSVSRVSSGEKSWHDREDVLYMWCDFKYWIVREDKSVVNRTKFKTDVLRLESTITSSTDVVTHMSWFRSFRGCRLVLSTAMTWVTAILKGMSSLTDLSRRKGVSLSHRMDYKLLKVRERHTQRWKQYCFWFKDSLRTKHETRRGRV